jgi:REP element-mobilizing transposase RayT
MGPRPRRSTQLSFSLPVQRSWGGRRPGAGRKRVASRPSTPHRARPLQSPLHPVLITLRACFRPLRSQHVLPTLRLAIGGANRRAPERFRITHSTVQYDHLHLIVEAIDKQALSSGMSSVTIRIARSVNALVGRRGRFWADRWHGRALTTPRQVRTALVYVLANFRKHSRRALGPGIDPFSSGAWFDGWQGFPVVPTGSMVVNGSVRPGPGADRAPPVHDRGHDTLHNAERDAAGAAIHQAARKRAPQSMPESASVSRPETWLARVGWRRYGLLRLDESPAGAPRLVRREQA